MLLLECCNVLELCASVQMEKMFQLEAAKPAGVCPLESSLPLALCSAKLAGRTYLLGFYGGTIRVNTEQMMA